MNTHASKNLRPLRSVALASTLAVLASLAWIGSAAAAGAQADSDLPPGAGWVRFGHFVTGLGAVEVQIEPRSGQSLVIGGVGYGDVTRYRKVPPGTYAVNLRPEGAALDSAPVLSRSFDVKGGTASTVAGLGDKSSPRLAHLHDDVSSPSQGSSRVRVVSGSANATGLSIAAVDGPRIASDVVLGQATPYTTVPGGDWTLQLTRKGAEPVRQVVTLTSGGVYTAVVLDGASKDAVKLDLVRDAQGALASPEGGANTGLGGTAALAGPSDRAGSGLVTVAVAVLGALMLLLGTVGGRRTTRRLTPRR